MSNKNKCPTKELNFHINPSNKFADNGNLLLFLNSQRFTFIKENPTYSTIVLESFFNILIHVANLGKNMFNFQTYKPQVTEKYLTQSKRILQKEINDFLATLRSPKRLYDITPITSFFIVHNHNNSYIKPSNKDTQQPTYSTPQHREIQLNHEEHQQRIPPSPLQQIPLLKLHTEKETQTIKVNDYKSRPKSDIKLIQYKSNPKKIIQPSQPQPPSQKDVSNKDIIEKIKQKMKANHLLQPDLLENNGCFYIESQTLPNNDYHGRNHLGFKPSYSIMMHATPSKKNTMLKKCYSNCKTVAGIPDSDECSFNFSNYDQNFKDKSSWERSIRPTMLTSRLLSKYHTVLDVYNKTLVKKERNNSYDYNRTYKTEINE